MKNRSKLAGINWPFDSKLFPIITLAAVLLPPVAFSQSTIVYDNLGTGATAGYSEANANNPIYGDALNLTQGGQLTTFGCSLYNSTSGGNTGIITNGTMLISFYDNTVAYAGGAITGALLGTATVDWSLGSGLGAGFYTTSTFDLTSLNIDLTQNIMVTQQFTESLGNSTRNGVVLMSDPVVGSSPANVFISSSATVEGQYSFTANPNQFAYQIQVAPIPEPSTLAMIGLGTTGLIALRRRQASR